MIRFLESLVLSGHYRSAVTEPSRIGKTRRSRLRPSGLAEVALFERPVPSPTISPNTTVDQTPEFSGQSSTSFAASIPDCGRYVGVLRSVELLKSDL
jgi:hypothetical protein